MNLVSIDGPVQEICNLYTIDIDVEDSSAKNLGNGRCSVGAYVTDDEIAAIRGRGLSVTIILNNEEFERNFEMNRPVNDRPVA